MINEIYNENCLETMRRMPDGFIDLVVTSPPYDAMRQYGSKAYHQRLNDKGFSFEFEDIATELNRVLKKGGVIMWNVADQTIKGSRTGNSMRQALYFMDIGLNLWDHLIWYKSGTPFPSIYRYRNVWENMFVFTKGKPNTFNPIMKKNQSAGRVWKKRKERNHEGHLCESNNEFSVKEFGIDDNVWKITNAHLEKSFKEIDSHPAVFPDEMCRRHIQSWTNEGDIVYDPFLGSGTTIRVAKKMSRNWIGSEIYQPYYDLTKKIITIEDRD
jgi:site-specific DNA-methyltransferase (adenine-specific)